jgi:hypothetical protein
MLYVYTAICIYTKFSLYTAANLLSATDVKTTCELLNAETHSSLIKQKRSMHDDAAVLYGLDMEAVMQYLQCHADEDSTVVRLYGKIRRAANMTVVYTRKHEG